MKSSSANRQELFPFQLVLKLLLLLCDKKTESSAFEINFIGKPLQGFRKASCSRCHRFMFPDSAEQRLNVFQFYLHSITRTVRTVDWRGFVWHDMEWALLHYISEWQQCNVALPPSNLLGVRRNYRQMSSFLFVRSVFVTTDSLLLCCLHHLTTNKMLHLLRCRSCASNDENSLAVLRAKRKNLFHSSFVRNGIEI